MQPRESLGKPHPRGPVTPRFAQPLTTVTAQKQQLQAERAQESSPLTRVQWEPAAQRQGPAHSAPCWCRPQSAAWSPSFKQSTRYRGSPHVHHVTGPEHPGSALALPLLGTRTLVGDSHSTLSPPLEPSLSLTAEEVNSMAMTWTVLGSLEALALGAPLGSGCHNPSLALQGDQDRGRALPLGQ